MPAIRTTLGRITNFATWMYVQSNRNQAVTSRRVPGADRIAGMARSYKRTLIKRPEALSPTAWPLLPLQVIMAGVIHRQYIP